VWIAKMMISLVAIASILALGVKAAKGSAAASNSSYFNPILPGFHPDPSCIFVPEWDHTFFCASSSFNAFPGIPIHASKDLRNWKLIGKFPGWQGGEPETTLGKMATD
jgi:beta-xylosidase